VDAAAFLRARLLDLLVGDWDRHPGQWRWAGFAERDRIVFRPVPLDRDWAFSHLDGRLPRSRGRWRTSSGSATTARRLPPHLERACAGSAAALLAGVAQWEAVIADLQVRLDDGVLRSGRAAPRPTRRRG
jgi:hypothetical protein